MNKLCKVCGEELPVEDFYADKSCKDGLQSKCKGCAKKDTNKWRKANREKYLAQARKRDTQLRKEKRTWAHRFPEKERERQIKQHQRLRQEVLAAYGGPVCACCGETEEVFLTIDHIDGGGRQHRLQSGVKGDFYAWLKRNGFPSGFQVLCWNCNHAKHVLGQCPHQKQAPTLAPGSRPGIGASVGEIPTGESTGTTGHRGNANSIQGEERLPSGLERFFQVP